MGNSDESREESAASLVDRIVAEKEDRDLRFLREAYKYAWKYSTDPSTATGALFVKDDQILSRGANYAPPGIELTDAIRFSEKKYDFIEHAERVGIYEAANEGISLKDSELFSPWLTCAPCFRPLLFLHLKALISHKELQDLSEKVDSKWGQSQKNALDMIKNSGIEYRLVSGMICDDISIRFKGKIYRQDKDLSFKLYSEEYSEFL